MREFNNKALCQKSYQIGVGTFPRHAKSCREANDLQMPVDICKDIYDFVRS